MKMRLLFAVFFAAASLGTAQSPSPDTLPYRGTSAEGGYSTVEDLLAFANTLQSHKLLNAEYADLLTTGKVETPQGVSALMVSAKVRKEKSAVLAMAAERPA